MADLLRPAQPYLNTDDPLASGLAAAWPMISEQGDAIRDLVSGRVAVPSGGPVWVADGAVGLVAKLVAASSQNWNAGLVPELSGVSAFTLSVLMRRSAVGTRIGIAQWSGATTAIEIFLHSDGVAYFYVYSGGGSGTISFPDAAWHVVTLVYDGTQATNNNRILGYVDGVSLALTRDGAAPAVSPSGGVLDFGAELGSGGAMSDGYIAGVWAWSRALSPGEVYEHAQQPWRLHTRPVPSWLVLHPPPAVAQHFAGSSADLGLTGQTGTLAAGLGFAGGSADLGLTGQSGTFSGTVVGTPTATMTLETIADGAVRVDLLDAWGATVAPTDPGNPIAAITVSVDGVFVTPAIVSLAGGAKRLSVPFVFLFDHTYTVVVAVQTADLAFTLFTRTFTVREVEWGVERVEARVPGSGFYAERVDLQVLSGNAFTAERVEVVVLSSNVVTVERVEVTVIPGLADGYFTPERVEVLVVTLVIVDVAFSVSMDVGDVAYALFAASEEIEGTAYAGFSASEDVTAEAFAPGYSVTVEGGEIGEALMSVSMDVGEEDFGAYPASVEGRGELLAGIEVRVELRNEDLAEVEDG